MARIIFITGGSRSGKSSYALKLAEGFPGPHAYLATCPILDEEMARRCRKHQEARNTLVWKTIEEEINIARVLVEDQTHAVLLVDCLTLWINNLIYKANQSSQIIAEEDIARECRILLEACAVFNGVVIFVSNEVGLGIVPDNALGRLFRDAAGRCNQIMAAAASEVLFLVSGIPLHLKKGGL